MVGVTQLALDTLWYIDPLPRSESLNQQRGSKKPGDEQQANNKDEPEDELGMDALLKDKDKKRQVLEPEVLRNVIRNDIISKEHQIDLDYV